MMKTCFVLAYTDTFTTYFFFTIHLLETCYSLMKKIDIDNTFMLKINDRLCYCYLICTIVKLRLIN